jgi:hypothetical protein
MKRRNRPVCTVHLSVTQEQTCLYTSMKCRNRPVCTSRRWTCRRTACRIGRCCGRSLCSSATGADPYPAITISIWQSPNIFYILTRNCSPYTVPDRCPICPGTPGHSRLTSGTCTIVKIVNIGTVVTYTVAKEFVNFK